MNETLANWSIVILVRVDYMYLDYYMQEFCMGFETKQAYVSQMTKFVFAS